MFRLIMFSVLWSLIHFLLLFAFAICFNRSENLLVTKQKSTIGALWNLNEMAECKLHYTALVYDNYGCWCGIGGSGTPIDGIDLCCKLHDQCYDLAVDRRLCYDTYIEYADPYSWKCQRGEPTCSEQQFGCKAALCECDKNVVDCWSKFKGPSKKKKCTKPNKGQTNEAIAYSKSMNVFSFLFMLYGIFRPFFLLLIF